MDELLQHCLRELAFDGDLGCDVSRLRDFVCEFYSSRISMQQNMDDVYNAFIWSLVVQHPSAQVGVLPDGQSTDVYVPPQPRVSKKGKTSSDDAQKENPSTATLNVIPNASHYSLDELVQLYGNRLRIAVDSETCFVALTGSHAKPAKLTPMVYAALQIIARSRESGVSVLELGKTTGYDQKTCFYLVKQLVDLDLVVKLRRGGSSQNFCVHKYFFERSTMWRNVREEETRVHEESVENGHEEEEAPGISMGSLGLPQFDPIDTRHLTSLNILRQRITKLLKQSPDGVQPYTNISVKIGFRPRSRTDRRFFIVRLNELINEGTIEKFFMPSSNPETTQNRQLYLRLTSPTREQHQSFAVEGAPKLAFDDETVDDLVAEDGSERIQVKSTMTIHRQVVDLLRDVSSTGATLNELSDRLGSYDKKTLELLISRMERQAPPPHLADLSVIQVSETHGRERRHRFFTLGGYSELIAREGFEQPSDPYSSENLAEATGFMEDRRADFYETYDELQAFYKRWSGTRVHKFKVPTTGDSGKDPSKARTEPTSLESVGIKAPRKKWTNPILPDGTRKRGRPPKNPDGAQPRPQKRARNEPEPSISSEPTDQNRFVSAEIVMSTSTSFAGGNGKIVGTVHESTGSEMVSGRFQSATTTQVQWLKTLVKQKGADTRTKDTDTLDPVKSRENVNTLEEEYSTVPQQTLVMDTVNSSPLQVIQDLGASTPSITLSADGLAGSYRPPVPRFLTTVSTQDHGAALPVPSPYSASAILQLPASASANDFHGVQPQPAGPSEPVDQIIDSVVTSQVDAPMTSMEENAVTACPEPTSSTGNVVVPLDDKLESACEENSDTTSQRKRGPIEGEDNEIESPSLQERGSCRDSRVSDSKALESKDPVPADLPSRTGRPRPRELKTNLTALRRESELVQLIENAGGIINTSTTGFLTTYMNFVEATVNAGEPTSSPVGTRTDRRTLNYALDKLEANGRIKLITTNIPSLTGVYRNARIAYLPTISQEDARSWLSFQGLETVAPPQEVPGTTEIDADSSLGLAKQWFTAKDSREIFHERWHRNAQRAGQLFSHSDTVVREALLMERQTLSQLYGYLTGKVARARELHLRTIEQLERKPVSPFIISLDMRIVSWSFFENDITLGTYCLCIPAISFVADIKDAVESENGRNMLVKNIPDEWRHALQIGKPRSRDRIFDLLDYLHSLRLAIPLRRAHSAAKDNLGDSPPISFEPMPSDWASRVPLVRPDYWQFSTSAPVHLFALQTNPAPFWKNVPTSSQLDAEQYWAELKPSCLEKGSAVTIQRQSAETSFLDGPYGGEERVSKALRRTASWSTDYTLSWYQSEYLKRFVDIHSGVTPLQDPDPEKSRLRHISSVIHAPLEVAGSYFLSSREMILRELEKKRRREARTSADKQEADMKVVIANKKLEAVKSREVAWDAMVAKVHPELVKGVAEARLRKLKQSYVRGNVVQDNHHWELQIQDAIKAAEKMRNSRRLFANVEHTTRGPTHRDQSGTKFSHLVPSAQGKPVELLINMQGDLVTEDGEAEGSDKKKQSRRRKGKDKGGQRRKRFQWNADYDELVRDAYAILKARCRTHHRLEWASVTQVFPSVPTTTVRTRLGLLKEQPGAEKYLERLEFCWHDLWIKKRGTPELPDPNPRHPTQFDLKAHVQYLRRYLDKNAIRVGVSTLDEAEYAHLPEDPNDLMSVWDLEERKPTQIVWDFLTNLAQSEETREKLLLEAPFVLEGDDYFDPTSQPDSVWLAESALKMVAREPDETYNSNDGAELLHGIGEGDVNTAMRNLEARNVLSKRIRDPNRPMPGRTVKISEMNQNALGGPIAKDLFLDATQLEESYEMAKNEWREWPLTSTDGDIAALLQLFSDHQVEFDADTSHARSTRATIEGNSRKVDDDDIELSLRVKLHSITLPESRPTLMDDGQSLLGSGEAIGHGSSISGGQACCGIRTDGTVDCVKCIEDTRRQLNDWPESDWRIAEHILRLADSRGKEGIAVEELGAQLDTDDAFINIIHRLHTLCVPLLYLSGYNSTTAVSAKYIASWAVTLPGGENVPTTRVLPRRWLDLAGSRVEMVWEAGGRAVVGLVHLRPGISQAELRWRLKTVYDRQEIFDLLNHLLSSGTLKVFYRGGWRSEKTVCIDAFSKEEEKLAFWTIQEGRRWYRMS